MSKHSNKRLIRVLQRRKFMLFTGCKRAKFNTSSYNMFLLSALGLISPMSHREFKRRFSPGARRALRMEEPQLDLSAHEEKERRLKRSKASAYGRKAHHKKRKLMPSDYAWALKQEGRNYLVPSVSVGDSRMSGRKRSAYDRHVDREIDSLEFWKARTEQYERQKTNARIRRLRKSVGLPVRNYGSTAAPRRSVRAVSIRVSVPLYEAMAFGECLSFNYPEMRGHERDFLPDSCGRPVSVVSVRTRGNDPDYDWMSFNIDGLERCYREAEGAWYWKITLGDRIPDDAPCGPRQYS